MAKKFTLVIDLENEVMVQDTQFELGRILTQVTEAVQAGVVRSLFLTDSEGNFIGNFTIEED